MTTNLDLSHSGKQRKNFILLCLSFSLLYCVFEIYWMRDLINLISNHEATREEIDQSIMQGRILAALGICFALFKGVLIYKSISLILRVAIFSALVFLAFKLIDFGYKKAVEWIPANESVMILALTTYRTGMLNQSIVDDDLKPALDDPMALVYWPLILFDTKFSAPVIHLFESRRSIMINEISSDKISDYDVNSRNFPQIRSALAAANKFEEEYLNMQNRLGARSTRQRQHCGMRLYSAMSRTEFAEQLKRNTCDRQARTLGVRYLDGTFINAENAKNQAGELFYMNRDQAIRSIRDSVALSVDRNLPMVNTIKNNSQAMDLVSAMVTPILALSLATVSVILNAGSVVAGIIYVIGLKFVREKFAFLAYSIFPIVFLAALMVLVSDEMFTREPMRSLEEQAHERFNHFIYLSKIGNIQRIFVSYDGGFAKENIQ